MAQSFAQTQSSSHTRCVICLDVFLYAETQQLTCEHRFCSTCLGLCPNLPTCPMPGCSALRNAELLVDEVDDQEDGEEGGFNDRLMRISVGANTLQLEERQRCDVIRGIFQCVNVARVTLADCHHRVCFDCLAKRITTADALDERPRCPFSRCANYLAGSEVLHVAEKVLTIRPLLPRVMPKIPDVPEKLSAKAKDEIRVSCSIFGSNDSTKFLNVPKICTMSDMTNAFMQILRVDKNKSALYINIFMRVETNNKYRYEHLNIKNVGKKTVKDANLAEKTHFVLDLNNELRKQQMK